MWTVGFSPRNLLLSYTQTASSHAQADTPDDAKQSEPAPMHQAQNSSFGGSVLSAVAREVTLMSVVDGVIPDMLDLEKAPEVVAKIKAYIQSNSGTLDTAYMSMVQRELFIADITDLCAELPEPVSIQKAHDLFQGLHGMATALAHERVGRLLQVHCMN